jgi:hypothetical protein
MGVLWSPLANIAILLALNSYWKYSVLIHGIYFAFATVITVATSFPILSYTGMIPANSTTKYGDFSASSLRTHYILGIVAIGTIVGVSLLGVLTKVLNILGAKSNTILLMRKIHKWSGLVIIWTCKINCYNLG